MRSIFTQPVQRCETVHSQQVGHEGGCLARRAVRAVVAVGGYVTAVRTDRIAWVAQIDRLGAVHRAGGQRQAEFGRRVAEDSERGDPIGDVRRQRVEPNRRERDGGENIDDRRALRIASQNKFGVGTVVDDVLDIGTRIIGAVSGGQKS